MASAQREVWTGAHLRRLLGERAGLEMSAGSVSAFVTKQPAQLKLQTLAVLCTALGCSPNDLLEVDTTSVEGQGPPGQGHGRSYLPIAGTAPAGRVSPRPRWRLIVKADT
jgi:putative transcriptional regulator